MHFKKLFSLISSLALIASCSAQIDSKDVSPFAAKADPRELPASVGPLSGDIEGVPWRMSRAIARYSNGEYTITLAGEGVDLTCGNFFPLAPQIDFTVPKTLGSYPYDGSAGGRLVNVIFPYSTPNGGGSNNVLAAKSAIDIESIGFGYVRGRLSALAPVGTEHSYRFGGTFSAVDCY